jgi:hypothetical protein
MKERERGITITSHEVVVTDIRMSFDSMIVFMVKWVIASILAIIILSIILSFVGGLIVVLLGLGSENFFQLFK